MSADLWRAWGMYIGLLVAGTVALYCAQAIFHSMAALYTMFVGAPYIIFIGCVTAFITWVLSRYGVTHVLVPKKSLRLIAAIFAVFIFTTPVDCGWESSGPVGPLFVRAPADVGHIIFGTEAFCDLLSDAFDTDNNPLIYAVFLINAIMGILLVLGVWWTLGRMYWRARPPGNIDAAVFLITAYVLLVSVHMLSVASAVWDEVGGRYRQELSRLEIDESSSMSYCADRTIVITPEEYVCQGDARRDCWYTDPVYGVDTGYCEELLRKYGYVVAKEGNQYRIKGRIFTVLDSALILFPQLNAAEIVMATWHGLVALPYWVFEDF